MLYPKIFKFLTLLISSTFLCVSSFEGANSSPQKDKPLRKNQQTQNKVALQETLEKAYMQNADLDAARADLRATNENVSQAIADWRPSLSVQAGQQQNISRPIDGAGTRSRRHTTSYTATIKQNIFNGGATVANIDKTESEALAGKAGLFETEQQTLLDAINAHTSVLANEAIVNYRKANEDFHKKNTERSEVRFEVGEFSLTDVEASKAAYEGAKAELSRDIGNYESSKATYTRQTGSSPGDLAPANIILELPKSIDDALEAAKAHNPLITQARYALEAAQYNVNLQLAGLLPQVDVDASVGNSRQGGTRETPTSRKVTKKTDLAFGATLGIPLYSQGIPNSKVRQAYQLVAKQKVQLVSIQRQVIENIKIAWHNLMAARESVKGFLAQVKAQELAVEGALEEVNVGTKTIIDVLDLQQNLINAQIELVRAQQTLIIASYQVLKEMGRLTARDLKLKVKHYDPDAYYNEYKNAWIQFWQGQDLRYVKDEDMK